MDTEQKCQTYFLTHFTYPDHYLLKETLQLYCHSILKDQNYRRNPAIFPILSYFIINNIPLIFKQDSLLFSVNSYYEANSDSILQGVSGNEYLRTSWDTINRSFVDILLNFFNPSNKKEQFLKVLSKN